METLERPTEPTLAAPSSIDPNVQAFADRFDRYWADETDEDRFLYPIKNEAYAA